MLKFPAMNHHAVGVSAVALVILGIGMAASSISHRPVRPLSEISSTQLNQHWVNPAELDANSLAKEIPPDAYGSAQPMQSVQSEATPNPTIGTKSAGPLAGAEAKEWSSQEWEIASKAVSAYRAVAKAANALTKAEPTKNVWQPPEEIAVRRQQNK